MKKTQTQADIVWAQLSKKGYVSRNWCLRRYITRLSAIAYAINKEVATLHGFFGTRITNKGDGDFYYVLPDFLKRNSDGTVTLINTK